MWNSAQNAGLKNPVVSFNPLYQPHHLIMQPWIHFRVKSLVKSLQSDTLTQERFIYDSSPHYFCLGRHDTNAPQVHCGCCARLFIERTQFHWLIPFKRSPQNVRYDRPAVAWLAISLIISPFTSIIMWSPPSSYSAISRQLLIQSHVIDRSPWRGI